MRTLNIFTKIYIFFSAASLLYVSLMAMVSPQAVMSLVQVTLPGNDAFSSIRGVYGGVGITIVVMLIRWALRDPRQGVFFLSVFWGMYALSRLITMLHEGPLGAFGMQWLVIETVLFGAGLILLLLQRRSVARS